jgi:hypothetical protein
VSAGRRGIRLAIPWTAVAVVALVVVAAAATYFLLLASKPADVAQQYLDAVKNGNDERRTQLATSETGGQPLLQQVLLIADFQIQREGVTTAGGQAEVPATVQLAVDPITIGLERAVLSDQIMGYLKTHPVQAYVVLAKQGLNWRVDQAQTKQRLDEAAFGRVEPQVREQLTAAGLQLPGPAPGPPPAAPAAPASPAKPAAAAPAPARPGA